MLNEVQDISLIPMRGHLSLRYICLSLSNVYVQHLCLQHDRLEKSKICIIFQCIHIKIAVATFNPNYSLLLIYSMLICRNNPDD